MPRWNGVCIATSAVFSLAWRWSEEASVLKKFYKESVVLETVELLVKGCQCKGTHHLVFLMLLSSVLFSISSVAQSLFPPLSLSLSQFTEHDKHAETYHSCCREMGHTLEKSVLEGYCTPSIPLPFVGCHLENKSGEIFSFCVHAQKHAGFSLSLHLWFWCQL